MKLLNFVAELRSSWLGSRWYFDVQNVDGCPRDTILGHLPHSHFLLAGLSPGEPTHTSNDSQSVVPVDKSPYRHQSPPKSASGRLFSVASLAPPGRCPTAESLFQSVFRARIWSETG